MRRTSKYKVEGSNALWQVYQTVSFWKVVKNFCVIQVSRYLPFMRWKNGLYRHLLHMHVGEKTAFALMVMPDIFSRRSYQWAEIV